VQHQRVGVGALDPADRHGDPGRGLVVRRAVRVHPELGGQGRRRAGLGLADRRLTQEGGVRDRLGELGPELAERGELPAVPDQPEGGDLPERAGPAIAEDHFVPVGQVEQRGDAPAQARDLVAHRPLPV
jgi:hypothetical protein